MVTFPKESCMGSKPGCRSMFSGAPWALALSSKGHSTSLRPPWNRTQNGVLARYFEPHQSSNPLVPDPRQRTFRTCLSVLGQGVQSLVLG